MPWPKPREDESEDDFISRCMRNQYIQEDLPTQEQRLAVCYQQWEDRNKGGETMNLERKSFTGIELKKDKPGAFMAKIATLNVIDKDGDVTLPGAFPEGKEILISAYMHGSWMGELPVGAGVIHEYDDEVLVEGQLNLELWSGEQTYKAIKFRPGLQEWSYGFKIEEAEIDTEWQGEKVSRILKKLDVFEASPVLRGAGVDTGVLAIKSNKPDEFKPYPNEHSCRLEDPDKYDTCRRGERTADKPDSVKGKKYFVIFCKKGDGPMEQQAFRYPKENWTAAQARAHCKYNEGSFEPASENSSQSRAEDTEGVTYSEQAEAALAAVKELLDRTKSLADLRRKEGRDLSPANRERISNLRKDIESIDSELKSLLENPEEMVEKGKEALKSLLKIYNEIQEIIK
jgi:hypothetical protein